MRLHLAVAAARDRLVASYPRMDVAEARPRVPCFYALELPRAVEGSLPELKEFEDRAREAAPARLNWPAPKEAPTRSTTRNTIWWPSLARDQRSTRRAFTTWWRPIRTWRDPCARAGSDGITSGGRGWLGHRRFAALEALREQRLGARAWSPSALEIRGVPLQFALHGIYGLRPRDEAEPLEQWIRARAARCFTRSSSSCFRICSGRHCFR